MKSLTRRLVREATRFQRDERGSIMLQVILFSLLMLMTTGLVLDSGRYFSHHGQMQAYADHMVLAAANELDGQPSAVQRAVNAVFGVSGNNPFMQKANVELGEFEIETISFFAVMRESDLPQSNMTEAFPVESLLASATKAEGASEPVVTYIVDQAVADSDSLFAVVKTREVNTQSVLFSVANILTSMGNTPEGRATVGTRTTPPNTWDFSVVSAATLSENNCAQLSNLVFCNPWENISPSIFDVPKDDPTHSFPGRSLLFFAPNFTDVNGAPIEPHPVNNGLIEYGSNFEWGVENQLYKLNTPLVDAGGVCLESNVPRLSAGEDYAIARDRCLMARAEVDQVCWGSDPSLASALTIRPVRGPSVSRAINTAFDIWMEPFDEAIKDTAQIPGTGLGYHQFFEPDMVATTLFEPADWYTDTATGTPQDGNPGEEYSDPGAHPPSQASWYLGHAGPAYGLTIIPRLYTVGQTADLCHAGTYSETVTGTVASYKCEHDFIGNHYKGASPTSNYPDEFFSYYWSNMYTTAAEPGSFTGNPALERTFYCGTSFEDTVPGLSDYCDIVSLPAEVDTWYGLYQRERAFFDELATRGTNSRVHQFGQWSDGTDPDLNDGFAPIDYQTRYEIGPDTPFIKHAPDDYFGISGETALFAEER